MAKDWIKTSAKFTNLKECLKKCQESMDQFAELSYSRNSR